MRVLCLRCRKPPNYKNFLGKAIVTVYSYKMMQKEKLFQKAKNNPVDVSFEDFRLLLKQAGWVQDHQRGSHQIWYSPEGCRLTVQNKKGKAKSYQVKQFLFEHEKGEKENAE